MKNRMINNSLMKLLPVLFSFFVMGFVDVVSVSTSYVKNDFGLNDKLANLLPMMVFLWFAICSLPTGALMDKIGRKKTVQLSAIITFIAMLIPLFSYTFIMVLVAFALLGIGNTILQVSLNPLLINVVRRDRVTSMLTLGQFIKAISSTLGPVIAGFAAGILGNWKLIFPVYAIITAISWIWLAKVSINEEVCSNEKKDILGLLKEPYLLMLFTMILLIVGFEIGLMTVVPKYLVERCGMPIEKAGLGCSLYFIARTIGTFIGSILLVKISSRKFLMWNMVVAIVFFLCLMLFSNQWIILGSIFFVGLFCANIFAVAFSAAIQSNPEKANDISAFMIMGVAGGALIPPVMGVIADASNQFMSLIVLILILIYILVTSFKLKNK